MFNEMNKIDSEELTPIFINFYRVKPLVRKTKEISIQCNWNSLKFLKILKSLQKPKN